MSARRGVGLLAPSSLVNKNVAVTARTRSREDGREEEGIRDQKGQEAPGDGGVDALAGPEHGLGTAEKGERPARVGVADLGIPYLGGAPSVDEPG